MGFLAVPMIIGGAAGAMAGGAAMAIAGAATGLVMGAIQDKKQEEIRRRIEEQLFEQRRAVQDQINYMRAQEQEQLRQIEEQKRYYMLLQQRKQAIRGVPNEYARAFRIKLNRDFFDKNDDESDEFASNVVTVGSAQT